jgi:hypothetical protein
MQKIYKFLLVPNTNAAYDYRMMSSLGIALSRYGHQFVISQPTESEYISTYFSYRPDIILAVNKARPIDGRLKRDVIYLSWFQDVYPETSDNLYFESSDKCYLLGTAEQLGLDVAGIAVPVLSLHTGVNPDSPPKKTGYLCDFSLCGGLPVDIDPPELCPTEALFAKPSLASILYSKFFVAMSGRNFLGLDYDNRIIRECKGLVESSYIPLTGTLDINDMYDRLINMLSNKGKISTQADRIILQLLHHLPDFILRRFTKTERVVAKLRALSNAEQKSDVLAEKFLASWMAQSYPRILDRRVLISYAERISRNIRVYGNYMDTHNFSVPYYSGVLLTDDSLANVYANSSINLGNNTHGLGLHSRNLGVMAARGYLLHHRSLKCYPGSLEFEFEEGSHYDAYSSPDEFEEISSAALANPAKRIKIGNQARDFVMSKHTWYVRAQQILKDLEIFHSNEGY